MSIVMELVSAVTACWALRYARQHKANGIISVPINPGNTRTQFARDQTLALKTIAHALCLSNHKRRIYPAFCRTFN